MLSVEVGRRIANFTIAAVRKSDRFVGRRGSGITVSTAGKGSEVSRCVTKAWDKVHSRGTKAPSSLDAHRAGTLKFHDDPTEVGQLLVVAWRPLSQNPSTSQTRAGGAKSEPGAGEEWATRAAYRDQCRAKPPETWLFPYSGGGRPATLFDFWRGSLFKGSRRRTCTVI